jgi:Tfp pilus assembly protein PilV
MKIPAKKSGVLSSFSASGFTLVEVMVTAGIFIIIIGAMVSTQIFGLRVYTLAATKITATAAGRETLNDIRDRIRSATTVTVGNYSNNTFYAIPDGSLQQGNALQISNSAAAGALVFYQDPVSNVLDMASNGAIISVEAQYMTNTTCFWAENYEQNILTNYLNNPVIRVTMQFYQWEYPIGYIGANGSAANAYDLYRLQTRVTRRAK